MKEEIDLNKEFTLLDLLDGIIDTGAVVSGELIISVADIDLILIDLKLLISSIETAFRNEVKGRSEFFLYETDSTRA
ncbi:gas vesicle protein GvpJ [Ammoniphilus sp. 3BR4]|uniref:gas vesicle protein GvpJ n=1 Tax=Ammoniphilus sp. 3BR4 TaxID=3158265 RepID=UPI0034653B78